MDFSQKYEHFTDAASDIKSLERTIDWHLWHQGERDGIEEQIKELILILVWCIKETEQEDANTSLGVGPYYYHELSKVYKNMERPDFEIRILERFAKQNHAPGSMPPKLLKRLEDLKMLY